MVDKTCVTLPIRWDSQAIPSCSMRESRLYCNRPCLARVRSLAQAGNCQSVSFKMELIEKASQAKDPFCLDTYLFYCSTQLGKLHKLFSCSLHIIMNHLRRERAKKKRKKSQHREIQLGPLLLRCRNPVRRVVCVRAQIRCVGYFKFIEKKNP